MATPVNSKLPVISGIAEVDRVLECHVGTWSESPTYTYQWKNAGSPISGATGKLYLVDATDQGDAITCTVTATSGVDSDTATTAAVTPGAANYAAGYRSGHNAGTDGDWFVDQATGDDGNAGTSTGAAFETIGAAVSAALAAGTPGQTIRVRAGKYPETVDLSSLSGTAGNPTRLLGYGTEKPVITGAEAITGWTQCDSGDEADVGANYASIYKKVVSTASIASGNAEAAFLHENGDPLPLATAQLPNPIYPLFYNIPDQWLTADVVNVDESDHILSYELNSLTDQYTKQQLENSQIYFHVVSNAARISTFTFNEGSKQIVLDDQTWTYESNSHRDNFSLINLLPALEEGKWGYKDNGDSTTTLYIWPTDTDNLTANIEYSTRGRGIKVGVASYVILGSLIVRQFSSTGDSTDGQYAISVQGLAKSSHVYIQNVWVKNNYRPHGGYSPITIQNVDNHLVECVTNEMAIGQSGFMTQGGSEGDDDLGMAKDGRFDSCVVKLAATSPFRMFTQRRHIISFCVAIDSGMAVHANKASYYLRCQECMWYGCNFLGSSGYLTWQDASAMSVVGCVIPTNYNGGSNRGIQDQNRVSQTTPADDLEETGASYILNNIILPYSSVLTSTTALNVGITSHPEVTFTIHNNVTHGHSGTKQEFVDAWDYNLLTTGSTVGANDDTDTLAGMYEDYTKGDHTLKAGAVIRTMAAKDLSSEIAILQARYPTFFGFARDLNGNALDWSDPPIGPVDDYDQGYDFDPIWIDHPIVTGLPVVGETLGLTTGFLAASPYPTLTYQWQRSDDGLIWANITDETSATYDTVEGDGGKFIACQVTPGSGPTYRAAMESALIVGGYPISDPVLLETKALWESGGTAKQLETDAFTASGKPLIVVVSCRGQLTDATFDVTIGTESRSFGTGTDLTLIGQGNRSGNQHAVLWIADPGSGSVTVQVEPDQDTNGLRIDVIEIDGIASVGTPATVGATATSRVTSVTTTESNSAVLHVLTRSNGSDSDTIAVSGATQVLEGNDGNTGTGNTRTNVAFETSPSAGSFDATFSWTGNASCTALSVELIPGAIVSATVTTADATFVTANSATLGGEVTDDGGAVVSERGVVYGLTENPTTSGTKLTSGTGTGAFTVNAEGLAPDTAYHHRAYAISTAGTSYGTDKTFTTDAADTTDPTVSTVTIAVNGDDVTLAMSEDVTATDWSGFSISGTNLTYASGSGSSTILFTADNTLSAGTKTLDYDPPVDGVQDGAGNLLAPIDGMAVTNNVPSEGGGSDGGLKRALAQPLARALGGSLAR